MSENALERAARELKDERRTVTPVVLANDLFVEVHQLKRTAPWTTKYGDRRDWLKGTRVYVDEVGETILDNLRDRNGRPTKAYKTAVLEALKHIELEGYRVCWSQRAGCGCGCSPGFILRSPDNKGVVRHFAEDGYTPVDIYVKIAKGDLGESKSRDLGE